MLKTTERLNLILAMTKHRLSLPLIKEFDADTIMSCCGMLDDNKLEVASYTDCEAIQRELFKDERFAGYLLKIISGGISKEYINSCLAELHFRNEAAVDYPFGRLISSMGMTLGRSAVFYDYLKFFSLIHSDKEQKRLIVDNLEVYHSQDSAPIADLPDGERKLLTGPYISETNLVPYGSINNAMTMLTQNSGLMDILRFFYENKIFATLELKHYESFVAAPGSILEKLREIFAVLGKDTEKMESLTALWLLNNCPLFDLQVLSEKLGSLDKEQERNVLESRSGYINLIYGGRISNIPLSEVPGYKEDILIYAITNNKNSFIRLVEENYELFSGLSFKSILFCREFYAGHVNLNSLNAKNLADCSRMNSSDMLFGELEPNRLHTFEEIKALYSFPAQYIKFYEKLDNPRVDTRLIVLKQLAKQKLLDAVTDDMQIDRLVEALNEKPLSVWREHDFSHIEGLSPKEVVELLIHRNTVGKFIPQMATKTDAGLVLRNRDNIRSYNSIDEMKENIVKIDDAWRELVCKMNFNEQFLSQNRERVIEFLCGNGAYITKTYYDGLYTEEKKESLRRIVKAELMGEFNKLKYFADDLRKEIDYPLSKTQKELWSENTEQTGGNITVGEHDDFYSTMVMGTVPQRTCLSYIDGQYKECLLSNFDSNKKILYAYMNGKIVGRAIIRFTKSKFDTAAKADGNTPSLSFVDLENIAEATQKNNNGEHLTLFLERYYTSELSPEKEEQVVDMFIGLMEKKAAEMGVMLVLSNCYSNNIRKGYARTFLNVYISRSKAGSQYLDSLNGSASISDEGGYKSNSFYIREDDKLKGGLENA